jgi:hypothetical protein
MMEDTHVTIEHGCRRRVMELFEEQFQERYISEEFVERQPNEFNSLRKGNRTVPEYEAHFLRYFSMIYTKLQRNLRSTSSCLALMLGFIFYFKY